MARLNFEGMFTGTYTAIVTPFRNGYIDEQALKKLIERQVRAFSPAG